MKTDLFTTRKSFSRIYEEEKGRVYFKAFEFYRCQFIAEDITQEVFLKLWKNRDRLNEIRNVSSYLFVMTRNICIRYSKYYYPEYFDKALIEMKYCQIEEMLVEKDYQNIWTKAISDLPKRQKEIYKLLLDGLNFRMIADALNIAPNTVKSLRSRALISVRAFVSKRIQMDGQKII